MELADRLKQNNPNLSNAVGAGLVKNDALTEAMQLQDQIDATANTLPQRGIQNPMQGGVAGQAPAGVSYGANGEMILDGQVSAANQDPYLRNLAIAAGGDGKKALELKVSLEKQKEDDYLYENIDSLMNVYTDVTKNIRDPKVTRTLLQAGVSEAALPEIIMLNTLKSHPDLQNNPELQRIVFSKAIGGLDNVNKWLDDLNKNVDNREKIQSEIDKNNASAKLADTRGKAITAELPSKINKNNAQAEKARRAPASKDSGRDKAWEKKVTTKQKELDSLRLKWSELDNPVDRQLEKGRITELSNQIKRKQSELDNLTGVPGTGAATKSSIFGNAKGVL
jgi:hypothetical protein